MAADALFGFDVGTTAIKGAAYSPQGDLLAIDRVEYATSRPHPNWVVQDPRRWTAGLEELWSALNSQADLTPLAIGLCSQVNTHVLADETGAPLGDAIVWQDTRCATVADQLDTGLTDSERIEIWDNDSVPIDSSSPIARAAWFANETSEAWESARWMFSPKDFCVFALTGQAVTDPISPIGLVDREGHYLQGALELVDGLERRCPPLAPFTAQAGLTTRLVPPNIPVAVGTMDAWANLYGSGVTNSGDAMEVAGTSEILGVIADVNAESTGVVSFPFGVGRFLHAGPTQAGGDSLRWFAEASGLTIAEALADADNGVRQQHSLLFLPHLAGERAPLWNPNAQGAWLGITRDTTRADLAAAVLEGVAYSARQLCEALEGAAAREIKSLRLSGGAAMSDNWNQIKANVHGRDLQRVANLDSGTFGAALMGGVAAGVLDSLDDASAELAHVERVFEPSVGEHERYSAMYQIYRKTYDQLVDVFDSLAEQRAEP